VAAATWNVDGRPSTVGVEKVTLGHPDEGTSGLFGPFDRAQPFSTQLGDELGVAVGERHDHRAPGFVDLCSRSRRLLEGQQQPAVFPVQRDELDPGIESRRRVL